MPGVIDQMVAAVEEGFTPRSVWETSLTYSPGSAVKVNKATTAQLYPDGGSVSIPEGTKVSIVGVGGGASGVDHHVMLPDGRQAIVPFYNLGESTLKKPSNPVEENQLVGSVAKVTLAKPLPQSALDWLKDEYYDWGVNLPSAPQSDSSTSVTFLMKAEDQETLDAAIEALKRVAGASFKSSAAASLTDWAEA